MLLACSYLRSVYVGLYRTCLLVPHKAIGLRHGPLTLGEFLENDLVSVPVTISIHRNEIASHLANAVIKLPATHNFPKPASLCQRALAYE